MRAVGSVQRLALVALLLVVQSGMAMRPAGAQPANPSAAAESDTDAPTPIDPGLPGDDEAGVLDIYHGPVASHFGEPMDWLLSPYDRLRSYLTEEFGIDYIWYYSPVFQAGSQDDNDTTGHHEVSFIGEWSVLESEKWGTSGFRWWYLHQLTYGSVSTPEFATGAGSSTATNGGPADDSESTDVLGLLWYEHWLFDKSLVLIAGKLDARQLISRLRYVGDDRQDFMNHSFFNKVVQPIFAAPSLGVFASYETEGMWISAIAKDGDADEKGIDFDSVDNGNFQYGGELGFTTHPAGLGEGRYRFSAFYNSETKGYTRDGWGVVASFDQDLNDRYSLFLRVSRSENQKRTLKTIASTGLIVRGIGPWSQDTVGFGFSWGDPSDTNPLNTRDQYSLEAFWNMRVTRRIEVTPDFQLLIDPSRDRGDDIVAVGGVRLYMRF